MCTGVCWFVALPESRWLMKTWRWTRPLEENLQRRAVRARRLINQERKSAATSSSFTTLCLCSSSRALRSDTPVTTITSLVPCRSRRSPQSGHSHCLHEEFLKDTPCTSPLIRTPPAVCRPTPTPTASTAAPPRSCPTSTACSARAVWAGRGPSTWRATSWCPRRATLPVRGRVRRTAAVLTSCWSGSRTWFPRGRVTEGPVRGLKYWVWTLSISSVVNEHCDVSIYFVFEFGFTLFLEVKVPSLFPYTWRKTERIRLISDVVPTDIGTIILIERLFTKRFYNFDFNFLINILIIFYGHCCRNLVAEKHSFFWLFNLFWKSLGKQLQN